MAEQHDPFRKATFILVVVQSALLVFAIVWMMSVVRKFSIDAAFSGAVAGGRDPWAPGGAPEGQGMGRGPGPEGGPPMGPPDGGSPAEGDLDARDREFDRTAIAIGRLDRMGLPLTDDQRTRILEVLTDGSRRELTFGHLDLTLLKVLTPAQRAVLDDPANAEAWMAEGAAFSSSTSRSAELMVAADRLDERKGAITSAPLPEQFAHARTRMGFLPLPMRFALAWDSLDADPATAVTPEQAAALEAIYRELANLEVAARDGARLLAILDEPQAEAVQSPEAAAAQEGGDATAELVMACLVPGWSGPADKKGPPPAQDEGAPPPDDRAPEGEAGPPPAEAPAP